MPPITDPVLLAQIQQQQRGATAAQPQAFSGVPLPPTTNRAVTQDAATQERLRLERIASQRAQKQFELAQAANARAEEEARRKEKQAGLTGGVDTTEAENTAAFLTTQLQSHVNKINKVLNETPEAIKPGWVETISGTFGERVKGLALGATETAKLKDARTILNNRYSLAADVLLTLGTGAAYTAEQKKAYVESYSPNVTDGPEALADKRDMMRETVIAARAKSGAGVTQVDRALAEIDKLYAAASPEAPPVDLPGEASTTQKTIPIPKGYQDAHSAFLARRRPGMLSVEAYTKLRNQLDEQFKDELEGASSRMSPQAIQKFVKEYNKGARISKIPGLNVDLTPLEQNRAKAATSAPGVLITNAMNAGTFGAVGLAASPEQRKAMEAANKGQAAMAMIGEVGGSLAPMKLLEKGGKKALQRFVGKKNFTRRQGIVGDIGVNATYGGMRGAAGAEEGERTSGFAKGLAAGAGAAVAGNAVTRGARGLMSDRTVRAMDGLKGVKLTTLQKLGLGKVEASGTGIPLAHGARLKSIKSFNINNANRALSYIGEKVPRGVEPGTELNAHINNRLSAAYNDLRPHIVGSEDGQFVNAITAIKAGAATPEKKKMFADIDEAIAMFKDENGHYTGQGYRQASERLRALIKDFSAAAENQGSTAARDMARAAEQTRKQMQHLIQRQTPEVGARLKKIERGWAHKMRIEDASNRALAADETGVYGPTNLLHATKALDTSANKSAFASGKAFDQKYAEDASRIMGGGNVPKINIRDTGYAAVTLGLGGYAAPTMLPWVAAAATGLYGPGIKTIVQAAIAGKRPSAIDNQIVRRALEDYLRHKTTGK